MVNKHYPPEFKADAVALYRSRPGATIAQIADDLGVNRETLRSWVRLDDQRRGEGGRRAAAGRQQPAGTVEKRTPNCGDGSASWKRNATSCGRRPGISPG